MKRGGDFADQSSNGFFFCSVLFFCTISPPYPFHSILKRIANVQHSNITHVLGALLHLAGTALLHNQINLNLSGSCKHHFCSAVWERAIEASTFFNQLAHSDQFHLFIKCMTSTTRDPLFDDSSRYLVAVQVDYFTSTCILPND